MSSELLLCAKCGSDKIEERAWTYINRGLIGLDGKEIGTGDLEPDEECLDYYCSECDKRINQNDDVKWHNE